MNSCNHDMTEAPNDGTVLWLTNDLMEKAKVPPKLCAWGWYVVEKTGEFKRGWYTLKCKNAIKPDRWCKPKLPLCFTVK